MSIAGRNESPYRTEFEALRDRALVAAGGAYPREVAERLARIVLDHMYQFVALLDRHGTLLEVNRAALEGGGITLADILGKPFWDAHWWTISAETQEALKAAVARAAEGEFVRYDVDVWGERGGTEPVTIDFSLIPIHGPEGGVVFLLAEGRIITEKKRAEAELARRNEELRTLYERLREFDQLKSQFFANISHELRTPLALILGPAEQLLRARGRPPEDVRALDVIRRNARTLLKHVNDLLDLAKLDASRMGVHYARVDLARLVRRVAALFDVLAEERGVAYTVDAPDSLPLDADAEKLERVVLNLLSNAFKFSPPARPVRLVLRAVNAPGGPPDGVDGDTVAVRLEVHDGGPGVPAALRPKIFERFRQADGGSTRASGGTGLGLAIVNEFAELHGGSVTVGDSPLGGALFTVELPVRAPAGAEVADVADVAASDRTDHVAAGDVLAATSWTTSDGAAVVAQVADDLRPRTGEHIAVSPAPTPGVAADDAERPHVLLVEDNSELNRFLAEALATEYRVTTAYDGADGLQRALENPPDIVVTDVMMPRMSGDALVRELRHHPQFDAVPVIVLTAKADDELRVELLRDGAQDYVVKPFSVEEVRARVRNLVSLKRARDVLARESAGAHGTLERMAEELAGQRRAAQAASQAKGQFLATMSHELRTPLNAILGYTQLLDIGVLGPTTPAQHAHLERLQASARHLLRLVDDVLDLAKVDADRLDIRRDPLGTGTVIAAALALVQPQATTKGVRLLDVGTGEPGVPFLGDEHRVRQVLVNLLSNAVKFSPPGGQVTVTCGAADAPDPGAWRPAGRSAEAGGTAGAPTPPSWTFVRVADTGPGIAPDLAGRLFEPFVQGDGALTRGHGGTGLGLTISRRLARLMGGDITVRSEPGAGATFTVWLPGREPASWMPATGSPDVPSRRTPPLDAAVGEGTRAPLDGSAFAVLHALSVRLAAEAETVAVRYVAALRADERFPGARTLPAVQLRDHATPFVNLLASQLMIIGETRGQASELLGDGGQVQRLMAELHGAQRHRLDWSEADIERETVLLATEIERVIRAAVVDQSRSTPPGSGPAGGGAIPEASVQAAAQYAVEVSRHVLERAARTAAAAFRTARATDPR